MISDESDFDLGNIPRYEFTQQPIIVPTSPIPTPIPTSFVNVTDASYSKPLIQPTPRVSVGYLSTTDGRNKTHSIYDETGIDMHETPIARSLDILNGPFTVRYTIHPKVENPNYSWAVLTLRDPWGNITAQNGYNRRYTNETIQDITVYKTGKFHLTIEGNFVTLDLSVRTTDPVTGPEPTQTPVNTDLPPEEMFQ